MHRLVLALLLLFWIAMNGWLWRQEFGGAPAPGERVELDLLADRLLAAPDPSTLDIRQGDRRLGFCRWTPNIVEAPAAALPGPDGQPVEGRVSRVAGYVVDIEWSLLSGEAFQRWRGSLRLDFDASRQWVSMLARLNLRPLLCEVEAQAGRPAVRVHLDNDGQPWTRWIALSDLRQPADLISELGLPPEWSGVLSGLTLGSWLPDAQALKVEARRDRIRVGRAHARVYRVEIRWRDLSRVGIVINRVGEILRVELPGDLVLLNEAISTW